MKIRKNSLFHPSCDGRLDHAKPLKNCWGSNPFDRDFVAMLDLRVVRRALYRRLTVETSVEGPVGERNRESDDRDNHNQAAPTGSYSSGFAKRQSGPAYPYIHAPPPRDV